MSEGLHVQSPPKTEEFQKEWFRISFQGTTPRMEKNILLGTNENGKVPTFHLATVNSDTNETLLNQVRMVQGNNLGHPSGFHPTQEDAIEETKGMLTEQVKALETAMENVEGLRHVTDVT